MAVTASTDRSKVEAALARAVHARAKLYALLDGARAPQGPMQAERAGTPCQSLLAGETGERLRDVAPYLIEFSARSTFAKWWFQQWGNSIGVWVESTAGLTELRTHFRTLLIVRHQDGRKYYFRFYDPRVLPGFLQNCTAAEATRFFGPIAAIHCESVEGKELLTFRPDVNGVTVKRTPLGPTGRGAHHG